MRLRLKYQGWSGCVIEPPEGHSLPALAFDPSPEAELEDRPWLLLVTHGHPEHVQGVARHLVISGRRPVAVVASRQVCAYLTKRSRHAEDRFHPVSAGASAIVGGWRVDVFAWRHMGLLPPDPRAKLRYLKKLFSNPRQLLRIALDGLFGPRHAPMLGFRVAAAHQGSRPIVYFGEGLHRGTTPEQLRNGLGSRSVETLVAAIEPEDVEDMPGLLGPYRGGEVLAFEAHRPWRARFGLPQVDARAFEERMRGAGIRCRTLARGQVVDLD